MLESIKFNYNNNNNNKNDDDDDDDKNYYGLMSEMNLF